VYEHGTWRDDGLIVDKGTVNVRRRVFDTRRFGFQV
jgi:hypothetical protein